MSKHRATNVVFHHTPSNEPEGIDVWLTGLTCKIGNVLFTGFIPTKPVLFVEDPNRKFYSAASLVMPGPDQSPTVVHNFNVTVRYSPTKGYSLSAMEERTEDNLMLSGKVDAELEMIGLSIVPTSPA